MKLINKKTGEIGDLKEWWDLENRNIDGVGVYISPDKPLKQYNSLAELNEEWEDYKEQKESYFIDRDGEIYYTDRLNDYDLDNMKNIGNYFETREEAEKAVEKLKAWKRLKESKIDSKVTEEYDTSIETTHANISISFNSYPLIGEDLVLLFGGEE